MHLALVLLLFLLQIEVLFSEGSQFTLEFVELFVKFIQLNIMCSSVVLELSLKDADLLTQSFILHLCFT